MIYAFKGFPPIMIYKDINVRQGLYLAALNFCNDEREIDIRKNKVSLSRIFLWYKQDFIEKISLENEDRKLLL